MKTKITLAIACFISFILCSAAVAYYPMLIVRECPHCKAHVIQEKTLSGNMIGATYCTDGMLEASMHPDHPLLVKCPICFRLFWLEDATEVDSGFDATKGKPQVMAPSEKELLGFLSESSLPKEKEFYLRSHAWSAANNSWRWLPNPRPAFSKQQVQNLKAFSKMLDETEPNHRILMAEIERELGNFDECFHLLSYQFDEGYERAVDFIRKLAQEKVRAVKPFEPGK